jgi:tetratricopeptide (TPR) repeat protein
MDWYRRSLAASKELGDRVSMATTYHNMGAMAARHGDHERALDLFRRSLVIREELGDRAGVAHGYHGLGAVAELRGDDQGALGWYRRSLAISHELGSQAGVAESSGAIGVLLTRVGNAEEAILPTLRALAIRLPMRLPEVHVHLEWLGRQRSAVGEGSFWNLVRTHLDDESLNNLRHLLDQAAAMSGEDG